VRRLTPAILTLVMFGIIGLLVLGYFAKNLFAQKEKPSGPVLRDLPMAVTDIKPGTVITADHLGVGRYEKSKLTPDVLLNNRVIVGRVAREPIKAASPIKAPQLYQPGELPPLDIGPGMRAVSVEIGDGVAMVDGIIKPGDAVDVLFTAQGAGVGNDNTFQGGLTMRLFEGVKVLAINRNFSQGRVDRGNNHVTLELTVAQTNIVVLAKDRGKITLSYNPNGKGDGGLALSNSERVTLYELLGLEKSDPLRDPFTTEIFRSGARVANRFDDKGRFVDTYNRNSSDPDRNIQYQLPNSTIPARPPAPGSNTQFNTAPPVTVSPQTSTVPGRNINQTLPLLDNPQPSRNAPTAQLPQPRN
jgi:pilus assembly protein CpaB